MSDIESPHSEPAPVLSVVIPLYNEEESLPELYRAIKEVVDSEGITHEILFIDDGSNDSSLEVIQDLRNSDPIVRVLSFRKNQGKSAALQVGFTHCRGDFVITMDADLQDDPAEIPNLINKLNEGYDLVSGWKKIRHDPITKTLPSKFFNFVVGLISGLPLHDFNCGLKGYRNDVVKSFNVYGELHRFLPVLAKWSGFRVTEIVVEHHARKYGKTKFGMSRFLSGFLDLITVVFISKYTRKPMHLFGSIGLVSMLAGFAICVYLAVGWFQGQWIGKRPILQLGVLLIVVGVQFFSIGLLGEMLTHSMEKERTYVLRNTERNSRKGGESRVVKCVGQDPCDPDIQLKKYLPAMNNDYLIHRDCRYFQGDRPCKPHKMEGVICRDCSHYEPITHRILIIKLGAIGDVIRTTPLLTPLREKYPNAEITWITLTPEVVPIRTFNQDAPDTILPWQWNTVTTVLNSKYDIVINLDKDYEACAVAQNIEAPMKFGFGWDGNRPQPFNERAKDKFLTGIDDGLNRANRKSYPREIIEICGLEYQNQIYILDPHQDEPEPVNLPTMRPLVGLNTGCSPRWKTRLWSENHWAKLAELLREFGYGVILLGGKAEDQKNRRIAVASGAKYPGEFPLPQFIRLIGEIDLMVTAVTMAMHVALGLNKKLVLLNNIFNRHEFELYDQGVIIEPDKECLCCFKNECDIDCLDTITPERIADSCRKLLTNNEF